MIVSYRDERARLLLGGQAPRGFPPDLVRRAIAKLIVLDAAERLEDLRKPPGNRLETLRGDREGRHSIRINDQWRICFRWGPSGAEDVEIVDYH